MLSKVLGGPRVQANPISGFLRVVYQSRYVDTAGRASIEEYTAVWDSATSTWKDSSTGGDFFIIGAGAGDPVPPQVTFVESFVYSGGDTRTQSWTAQPIVNNGNDFNYASVSPGSSFVTAPPLSLTQLEAANTAAQAIIAALPNDALRAGQLGVTVAPYPVPAAGLPQVSTATPGIVSLSKTVQYLGLGTKSFNDPISAFPPGFSVCVNPGGAPPPGAAYGTLVTEIYFDDPAGIKQTFYAVDSSGLWELRQISYRVKTTANTFGPWRRVLTQV